MFKMRNAVGSAVIMVKSERRRDELLRRGFTLEKTETKPEKSKNTKTK